MEENNSIVVLQGQVDATRVGLIFKEGMNFDEWQLLGTKLRDVEGAVHWWIGDWLNYGEQNYGQVYTQALEETGFEYPTLANDKWITSRIESSRRRENLSFSHHCEVTSLDPIEQDKFLDKAEQYNWTRSELRAEVYKYKNNSTAMLEAKAISGLYDVIVIDPPWPVEKIVRDVAPKQGAMDYPTMTIDELLTLDIPTSQDCHVLLWTTHKFLPSALWLLEMWQMEYVCTFVWHKPGGFQPFGLPQYNCEFVLYARKGSPQFVDFKDFMTCFTAPRGEHNEKPEAFYDTIRRVTAGRRLDMFSRRKIEGFDSWGKEAVE